VATASVVSSSDKVTGPLWSGTSLSVHNRNHYLMYESRWAKLQMYARTIF